MANCKVQVEFGIDVAKDELVIYRGDTERCETLINAQGAIKSWLKTVPKNAAIAIEATGTYHLDMAELAQGRGLEVFVIDGHQLSNYRKGIGQRAKTDDSDAALLARYLRNEGRDLRRWTPPPAVYRILQSLLRRRALLVQIQQSLQLSFGDVALLRTELKTLKASIGRVVLTIEKKIKEALTQASLMGQIKRIQAVEGIGFLTAAGLVMAYNRGEFANADAFIAFLGMDLRVADSGQKSGKRRLSKQGCGEPRRLLHNAAMSACRTATWKSFYQRCLIGRHTTEALVILARKLARIAFSLMRNESEYKSVVRA